MGEQRFLTFIPHVYPATLSCSPAHRGKKEPKTHNKKETVVRRKKSSKLEFAKPFHPLGRSLTWVCLSFVLALCLSTAVLMLDLFLFDYIPRAGCLYTQGQCTHMRPLFSVYPRQQPHSWSPFSFSIHCSKYNYQQCR